MFREHLFFLSLVIIGCIGCRSDLSVHEVSPEGAIKDTILTSSQDAFNADFNKRLSGKGINVDFKTVGNQNIKSLELVIEDPVNMRDIMKSFTYDGTIMNAQIADLNNDGKQEIYIFNTAEGSGSYGQVFAFQLNLGKTDSISMDDLPDHFSNKYMGHDSFYLDSPFIKRMIPLYNEEDAYCCPTGGKKTLKYQLSYHRGNLRLKAVPE